MRRSSVISNPIVVGGILGVTASVYAMSRMNMGQRRKVFKIGRNVAKMATKVIDRVDMPWM